MDLIDRAAALEALGEKPFNWNETPEEAAAIREYTSAYNAIASVPTIEAVPLDKLCEWLSSHAYKKTGYYITDPGEALYAQEWEYDIREWMEGLDAAD